MPLPSFAMVDLSTEEVLTREAEVVALTDAIRALVDAGIRTTVPLEDLAAARAEIESVTKRLTASQVDGAFGVKVNHEGHYWYWGNAAMGLGNAVAPPMSVARVGAGHYRGQATCGAAYEGAPGLLHGGIAALLLDQVMSEAACDDHRRAVTASLQLDFKRPTPLGELAVEARTVREEGRKVTIAASLRHGDGVSIEAEGLFITLDQM